MSQSESSGIEIHAQKPFILNIQKAECGNENRAPLLLCENSSDLFLTAPYRAPIGTQGKTLFFQNLLTLLLNNHLSAFVSPLCLTAQLLVYQLS